jgi:hypothetical protein
MLLIQLTTLTGDEQELVEIYRSLTPNARKALMVTAKSLKKAPAPKGEGCFWPGVERSDTTADRLCCSRPRSL